MLLPPVLYWLMVAVWGLALGSFTTCVMYRVPRRISLWQQQDGSYRSFCPSCKTPLQPIDLIPFFSWAMQKGKCRYCGASIGFFYPMIEVLVLLAVMGLAWLVYPSLWIFLLSFCVPVLAAVIGLLKR